MTSFDGRGLRDTNMLAFLALLGAMRAVDTVRPTWNVRVQWVGPPYHPRFSVVADINENAFLTAMSEGASQLASSAEFAEQSDVKFSELEARTLLASARSGGDPERERWYAALFSDGALKDGKDASQRVVVAPPLVTMLGQGHQHFLTRVIDVGRGRLPKDMMRGKVRADLNAPDMLARAIFADWERRDKTDSFRWDPEEDRRYAFRDRNPSNDAGTTEHGANRLAICALPLFTSLPTGRRGAQAITTLGFSSGPDRTRRFTWPIWTSYLDLATIVALLSQRVLHTDPPRPSRLAAYGVIAAMRSLRVENGYYANFAWAETHV